MEERMGRSGVSFILSSIGTCGYKIAKFLVPILEPLTSNQFTILDSFSFASEISHVKNNHGHVMASFDIKSLFTNIPLEETIDIATNSLFPNENSSVLGLTPGIFRKLLQFAVKNVLFIFNNKMYQQIDGVAMGNPLGPTLANLFLCHHETNWLSNCPLEFKPVLYRRYIDDTFLLFRDISHIDKFLNYINSQHSSIQFTSEIETNSMLNFLDITVSKIDDTFKTSVFRKKTFTGLGMKFDSFVPHQFKTNLISCLIKRAFKICSEETAFNAELSYLQKYFTQNNFPSNFVSKMFKKILHNIYNPKPVFISAAKKPVYFHLPYMGKSSFEIKRQLKTIISRFYPHIQIRFIFTSKFTVGSLFRFKDKLPSQLLSSVIYEYKCGQCTSSYIGQTGKQLKIRISQHRGRSFRTDQLLTSPEFSNIRNHAHENNHPIHDCNFKILDTCNSFDLRLLESIYIHKKKSSLNDQNSSTELNILT